MNVKSVRCPCAAFENHIFVYSNDSNYATTLRGLASLDRVVARIGRVHHVVAPERAARRLEKDVRALAARREPLPRANQARPRARAADDLAAARATETADLALRIVDQAVRAPRATAARNFAATARLLVPGVTTAALLSTFDQTR